MELEVPVINTELDLARYLLRLYFYKRDYILPKHGSTVVGICSSISQLELYYGGGVSITPELITLKGIRKQFLKRVWKIACSQGFADYGTSMSKHKSDHWFPYPSGNQNLGITHRIGVLETCVKQIEHETGEGHISE